MPVNVREDSVLAKVFLEKAYRGVSLNTLTFRRPTVVHIVDACEHRL